MIDQAGGVYRCVVTQNGVLRAALFLAPSGSALLWDTVKAAFADEQAAPDNRLALLAGAQAGRRRRIRAPPSAPVSASVSNAIRAQPSPRAAR